MEGLTNRAFVLIQRDGKYGWVLDINLQLIIFKNNYIGMLERLNIVRIKCSRLLHLFTTCRYAGIMYKTYSGGTDHGICKTLGRSA